MARERAKEINAAVVLCGALRHFDKSHRELTTPADSTLKSDWLEQLQVRRMLMDMMWTTNHTHTHTHKDTREQIGHTHTHTLVQYMDTLSNCVCVCVSLAGQLQLMMESSLVTHLIRN